MDRRSFLGGLAAAGAGILWTAGCARQGAALGGGRTLDRIGVQLYTVRDRMERDVEATLRDVAALGYREVETAGLFERTPGEFRAILDRHGLSSPAGHVPIDALRQNLDATLSAAQTLGQRWAVVPWLAEAERTPEGYRRVAADLNRFGRAAAERGMRVAYHNHEWEFAPLAGGGTGYDILLADTDPALVDMELDLFWAVHAGQDPIALFAAHPGRFPLCHVKDMVGIGGERRMVAVGEGEIDFAAIFARSEEAGLVHFFVEHDHPPDSLASIRQGIEHLRGLSF